MKQVDCWLCSSLERVFRSTPSRAVSYFRLDLARNDKGSFQACVRQSFDKPVKVGVFVKHPDGINVKVRRVGHVPIPHFNTLTTEDELDGIGHIPGYVPDPLFEDTETLVASKETEIFWISVETVSDTPVGEYAIDIVLNIENEEYVLHATVCVHPFVIQKRKNFPVTHWFYVDAICDWYKMEPFDEACWNMVVPFMKDIVSHGINVMHTPIFTPSTDGIKRPNQLLRVKKERDGEYTFDWQDVKRWVTLAKECGMEYFEWAHFFTQWGAAYAVQIYENYDGCYDERMLWECNTPADAEVYRSFLVRFLPEFKRFLDVEGLTDISFFHVSDEPDGDKQVANYMMARKILRDLAPWMKVIDTMSNTVLAEKGCTDMPIACLHASLEFQEKKIPRWDYFCCGPRGEYMIRLMDTPLPKIRGAGWLFYRLGALGFLHWGYNYWYKHCSRKMIDPYTVTDAMGWPDLAYGDPFVVYPGENGPVDSIRWEVFAESLHDYAMLQTLGIDQEDKVLAPFRSYTDYPKDAMWYVNVRNLLIRQAK